MNCKNCGKEISEGSKFCMGCGTKVEPPVYYNHQPAVQTMPANNVGVAPLKVSDYIIMAIILAIPLVGFVMLFVWGFGDDVNLNRKNYARAQLIIILIVFVLSIVISIFATAIMASIFGSLGPWSSGYQI